MRITRVALSTVAVAGLLNTAALAQSTADKTTSSGQDTAASSSNKSSSNSSAAEQGSSQAQRKADQAPEGWVLVEERTVVLTANEPQNHFLRAQQLMSQKDNKAAAGEIRMAAAYLDMQASRGHGQQPDAPLTQSADRLRQVARQVEQQQPQAPSEQQLKQTFAQANAALAQHLQSLAQREIQNGKSVMAGHDLNTAADSLASAFAWDGQQPPLQANSAIQESKQLAVQLLAPEAAQEQQASNTADRAQTASAQQQGSQSQSPSAQPPANAKQTIQQLGQAIQQASSTFQQGGNAQSSSNQNQQNK